MAQHLVSIDIAAGHVRFVVLEATFRTAELISATTFRMEETSDRETFWRQIRAALPPHVDSVIATADATATSTRVLNFPFEDLRKVEAALDFELENQVPFDLEDLATTWNVASRGNGHTQLLTAVMPRADLIDQLDELRATRLEPRSLVIPAAGLAELVDPTEENPVAIAALGETQTHLAVVQDGLRFARTIRAGGHDVDRALARAYDIDMPKARDAKEREAQLVSGGAAVSDDARKASGVVAEGLNSLVRQIAATFKALPPEQAPHKLIITGGLSRLPGLDRHLQETLGIPVELLDLRERIEPVTCRPQALGPEYAVAVGLALSSLRRGAAVPLNFRRGEFAYAGDIRVYRSEVMRIAVGLAVVTLLAIAGSVVRYSQVSAEEEQIRQAVCQTTKKIVGREICDITVAKSVLQGAPALGEGVVIPAYSAAEVFNTVSTLIDTNLDVSFDDLEFRVDGRPEEPDRISGKAEAASFETTEQIVAKLKAHPCIEDAEVSKQKKARNSNRVEFHLAAKVRCPPGVDLSATTVASAMPEKVPGKPGPGAAGEEP